MCSHSSRLICQLLFCSFVIVIILTSPNMFSVCQWNVVFLTISMLYCLQIAPVYLTSCMKQGMGLLEILLCKQPVQHNELLHKVKSSSFGLFFYHCTNMSVYSVIRLLFSVFLWSTHWLIVCTIAWQNLEICRLYELDDVSSHIMKVTACLYGTHTFVLDCW